MTGTLGDEYSIMTCGFLPQVFVFQGGKDGISKRPSRGRIRQQAVDAGSDPFPQ